MPEEVKAAAYGPDKLSPQLYSELSYRPIRFLHDFGDKVALVMEYGTLKDDWAYDKPSKPAPRVRFETPEPIVRTKYITRTVNSDDDVLTYLWAGLLALLTFTWLIAIISAAAASDD